MCSLALAQYHQPPQHQQQPQDDGQYKPQQYRDDSYSQPTRPPPKIISHKQAQNHDGAFKYAFAAENGLSQGEIISPDGSRNGGYTYVDPHGKKISVKYTAGKEGFRIIEGDHLPKSPEHAQPAPAAPYNQYQQRGPEDDGSYRPELYEKPEEHRPAYAPPQPIYKPAPAPYRPAISYPQPQPVPQYQPQPYHQPPTQPQYQPRPQQYQPPQPSYEQRSNQLEEKEPEYHDEPGKPNTFGNGYFFEFAG